MNETKRSKNRQPQPLSRDLPLLPWARDNVNTLTQVFDGNQQAALKMHQDMLQFLVRMDVEKRHGAGTPHCCICGDVEELVSFRNDIVCQDCRRIQLVMYPD